MALEVLEPGMLARLVFDGPVTAYDVGTGPPGEDPNVALYDGEFGWTTVTDCYQHDATSVDIWVTASVGVTWTQWRITGPPTCVTAPQGIAWPQSGPVPYPG